MNPFYFNDTAAYLIDPSFTKEEVTGKGYLWRDEPIKVDIPANAEIIKVEALNLDLINSALANKVICFSISSSSPSTNLASASS